MKKFTFTLFLLGLLFFFSGCATPKLKIGIVTFEFKNLQKDVSQKEKDAAAYYYSKALTANETGDWASYFSYLTFAFMYYPANENILSKYAKALYVAKSLENDKKYSDFILQITKWAEKEDIDNADLFFYTALAYQDEKKYKKADEYFKKALSIKENTDILASYFDFIRRTKGYADKKILKKLIKFVEDDKNKLLQLLYILLRLEPQICLDYSKEYYQKYNDDEFEELLFRNYSALKQTETASRMVFKKVLENNTVSPYTLIKFLEYESNSKFIPSDSLALICNYKQWDKLETPIRVLIFSTLFDLKDENLIQKCYNKLTADSLTFKNKEDKIFWYFIKTKFLLSTDKTNEVTTFLSQRDTLLLDRHNIVFSIVSDDSTSLYQDKLKKAILNIKDEPLKHFYLFSYYKGKEDKEKALNELEQIDESILCASYDINIFFAYQIWNYSNDEEKTFRILQITPNDTLTANYRMAQFMASQKERDKAVKYILKDVGNKDFTLNELFSLMNYADDKERYYQDILNVCETYEDKFSNDAYFLNAYGYFIADKNIETLYPKAKTLLLKANELLPKSSFILDSMAWLFYKMKDYKKAEDWIKSIDKKSLSSNSEILYHYGMIELKLHKKKEAIMYFKFATTLRDNKKYQSLSSQRLFELGERNK